MKEFRCGSPECNTQFTAADTDELHAKMATHLKDAHNVQTATQTLVSYLEANAVTDTGSSRK